MNDGEFMVNMGCGATPTPGYLNFDNSLALSLSRFPLLPGLLRVCRILPEDSGRWVGGLEEPVGYADAARRIPLPDLRHFVDRYLENGDGDEFMDKTCLAAPSCRGFKDRLRLLVVGHRHHLWMYDSRSLQALLESVGFSPVVPLAAGETTILDPGQLNLREREEGSLYMEAVR